MLSGWCRGWRGRPGASQEAGKEVFLQDLEWLWVCEDLQPSCRVGLCP